MHKNKIRIAIQLQSGQISTLELSPTSYKTSFREFKQKYGIDEHQAYKIKSIVQATLIQIANENAYQIHGTPKKKQRLQEVKESPRFRKIFNDQEVTNEDTIVENRGKQDLNKRFENEEILEEMPLTPARTVQKKPVIGQADSHQNIFPRINIFQHLGSRQSRESQSPPSPLKPPEKTVNFEPSNHQIHKKTESPNELLNIFNQPRPNNNFESAINNEQLTVKMQTPTKQKRTNKKQKNKSSDRINRLYYQATDSFRSKNNEDINRKELMDYIEVQKYDLNNKLKRTSKGFFYELHNHSTEAWNHRILQKYSQKQEQLQIPQTKKVPIAQAFKGSNWESRMRCQAKQYEKKLNAQQKLRLKEQSRIRQRVRSQKSISPSSDKKQRVSRMCEKCSPKQSSIARSPIKIWKQSSPKLQSSNRPKYFANLLSEAYQERQDMTRLLKYS